MHPNVQHAWKGNPFVDLLLKHLHQLCPVSITKVLNSQERGFRLFIPGHSRTLRAVWIFRKESNESRLRWDSRAYKSHSLHISMRSIGWHGHQWPEAATCNLPVTLSATVPYLWCPNQDPAALKMVPMHLIIDHNSIVNQAQRPTSADSLMVETITVDLSLWWEWNVPYLSIKFGLKLIKILTYEWFWNLMTQFRIW